MFNCSKKKPADSLICGLFFVLFFLFIHSSHATHPAPFLTRNQSPFSLIYGIPFATSAQLLEKNQSRWISTINISNTINKQSKADELFFIDIETLHTTFLYDYSFDKNWMLRIQLPYIVHSGGFLDSTIDTYHQALNLPENIRPSYAHNEININYQQNNIQQLNITDRQQSLADISLQLAWQKNSTTEHALSYWLNLKLPTGDAKKITGSGALDISTWVSADYKLKNSRWIYGQAGILYMGDSDVLTDNHKNWATFYNIGTIFHPWEKWELKTQFDIHSAVYQSDIKFLSHVIQFTFGGSYQLNLTDKIDFAVVEDINSGASPDVNFNIGWWVYY